MTENKFIRAAAQPLVQIIRNDNDDEDAWHHDIRSDQVIVILALQDKVEGIARRRRPRSALQLQVQIRRLDSARATPHG